MVWDVRGSRGGRLVWASFVDDVVSGTWSWWAWLSEITRVVWAWVRLSNGIVVECGWGEGLCSAGSAEVPMSRVPF